MGNGSVWTAGTDRGSGGAGAHGGLLGGGSRTGGPAQKTAAQPSCGRLLGVGDQENREVEVLVAVCGGE